MPADGCSAGAYSLWLARSYGDFVTAGNGWFPIISYKKRVNYIRKFRTTDIFATNCVDSLNFRASREVFQIEVRSPEISIWNRGAPLCCQVGGSAPPGLYCQRQHGMQLCISRLKEGVFLASASTNSGVKDNGS